MNRTVIGGIAALAFGAAASFGGVSPASAQLAASPGALGIGQQAGHATEVQFRRGWRGRGGYYRRGPHPGAIIGGLAAGAIIGGALAARPYYYYGGPYYAAPYDRSAYAYCAERFRSWDPVSRTYLGYDGRRHPCP